MRLAAGGTAPQLALELDRGRPAMPVLDTRQRGARFVGLASRTVLNSPLTTGMDFWTLNPYVGCEFGCSYCYARNTHRWVTERHADEGPAELTALDPLEAFERNIFVKRNAALVLRRTLDPRRLDGRPLLIGTATDPYQPAERRFGVTRSVLEALTEYRGLEINVTTKSALITRDVDLLRILATRHRLRVNISLISVDRELIRRLEPRTPLPHARLRALATLAEAGVRAGVMIAPIVPGLTDGWGALGGLLAAAKEAGAGFAVGSALRLSPGARAGFLPLLEREFPELVARYRRRYGARAGAEPAYLDALARRFRTLRRIHGLEDAAMLSAAGRRPRQPPASGASDRIGDLQGDLAEDLIPLHGGVRGGHLGHRKGRAEHRVKAVRRRLRLEERQHALLELPGEQHPLGAAPRAHDAADDLEPGAEHPPHVELPGPGTLQRAEEHQAAPRRQRRQILAQGAGTEEIENHVHRRVERPAEPNPRGVDGPVEPEPARRFQLGGRP